MLGERAFKYKGISSSPYRTTVEYRARPKNAKKVRFMLGTENALIQSLLNRLYSCSCLYGRVSAAAVLPSTELLRLLLHSLSVVYPTTPGNQLCQIEYMIQSTTMLSTVQWASEHNFQQCSNIPAGPPRK